MDSLLNDPMEAGDQSPETHAKTSWANDTNNITHMYKIHNTRCTCKLLLLFTRTLDFKEYYMYTQYDNVSTKSTASLLSRAPLDYHKTNYQAHLG